MNFCLIFIGGKFNCRYYIYIIIISYFYCFFYCLLLYHGRQLQLYPVSYNISYFVKSRTLCINSVITGKKDIYYLILNLKYIYVNKNRSTKYSGKQEVLSTKNTVPCKHWVLSTRHFRLWNKIQVFSPKKNMILLYICFLIS